jgi:hypothetical protein
MFFAQAALRLFVPWGAQSTTRAESSQCDWSGCPAMGKHMYYSHAARCPPQFHSAVNQPVPIPNMLQNHHHLQSMPQLLSPPVGTRRAYEL